MTTVVQITRRSQTTQRPGLWAEREAQGPFRIERRTVTYSARGDALQVEYETIEEFESMVDALTARETFKDGFVGKKHVNFRVIDATDHSVSLMDFALIHLGREGFDKAVADYFAK